MQSIRFGGRFGPCLVALATISLGCGDSGSSESYRPESPAGRAATSASPVYGTQIGTAFAAPTASPISADSDGAGAMPGMAMAGMMGGMGQADKAAVPTMIPNGATAGRKIVYNSRLELVTDDLGKLESSLLKLISANKAYVADSDRTGSAGSSRQGTWKVRVPVDGFDVFLKNAVGLGELVAIKTDSQDVSEEFFDLDARQTAKKVEEARLLKHLTDSTGKLIEILSVERELSRVRSEIERMQGRLRVIANLTELATVTITAREIKNYTPPQAPTFITRLGRRFGASVDALRECGEAVLLLIVSIAPWLPVIIPLAAIALWIGRIVWRRQARQGPAEG